MNENIQVDVVKILKSNNLYEILGVAEDISQEELKSKFRKVV